MSPDPRIALLVITDGRANYLDRTLDALERYVDFPWHDKIVVNDNEDPYWQAWLSARCAGIDGERFSVLHPVWGKRGFAGAIQAGWEYLTRYSDADYVFHLEDDFVFTQYVSVEDAADLLKYDQHIAQVVYKRQPWNGLEQQCGGIVEQDPDSYTEFGHGFYKWTEHRNFWSTNPCVYRKEWCELGWPDAPDSERKWSDQLLNCSPDLRFAFWGGKFDDPVVEHIGYERAGSGY